MAIEVHNPVKPAARYRALVTTAAMLLLGISGAVTMSHDRGSIHEGQTVGGPEFGASFTIPGQWGRPRRLEATDGVGFLLSTGTSDGRRAVMRIRRVAIEPGVTPEEVCVHVLRADLDTGITTWGSTLEATVQRLGDYVGIEVSDQGNRTIVRGVVFPGGVAFVTSISVQGTSMTRALYHSFRRLCESFEFHQS
jgi:hypothetical protein